MMSMLDALKYFKIKTIDFMTVQVEFTYLSLISLSIAIAMLVSIGICIYKGA